jgi:ribosomal protein L3 glutamine methyltransferase
VHGLRLPGHHDGRCLPDAHVDAVDISADALEVAKRNVATYELQDRLTLIQSDLYANVPAKKYDLIITNPPYVNSSSMSKLPMEYRAEPNWRWTAADGMDIVRRIVAGAAERLTDDGLLIVEIGNERNSRKPPSVNWA